MTRMGLKPRAAIWNTLPLPPLRLIYRPGCRRMVAPRAALPSSSVEERSHHKSWGSPDLGLMRLPLAAVDINGTQAVVAADGQTYFQYGQPEYNVKKRVHVTNQICKAHGRKGLDLTRRVWQRQRHGSLRLAPPPREVALMAFEIREEAQ